MEAFRQDLMDWRGCPTDSLLGRGICFLAYARSGSWLDTGTSIPQWSTVSAVSIVSSAPVTRLDGIKPSLLALESKPQPRRRC